MRGSSLWRLSWRPALMGIFGSWLAPLPRAPDSNTLAACALKWLCEEIFFSVYFHSTMLWISRGKHTQKKLSGSVKTENHNVGGKFKLHSWFFCTHRNKAHPLKRFFYFFFKQILSWSVIMAAGWSNREGYACVLISKQMCEGAAVKERNILYTSGSICCSVTPRLLKRHCLLRGCTVGCQPTMGHKASEQIQHASFVSISVFVCAIEFGAAKLTILMGPMLLTARKLLPDIFCQTTVLYCQYRKCILYLKKCEDKVPCRRDIYPLCRQCKAILNFQTSTRISSIKEKAKSAVVRNNVIKQRFIQLNSLYITFYATQTFQIFSPLFYPQT